MMNAVKLGGTNSKIATISGVRQIFYPVMAKVFYSAFMAVQLILMKFFLFSSQVQVVNN